MKQLNSVIFLSALRAVFRKTILKISSISLIVKNDKIRKVLYVEEKGSSKILTLFRKIYAALKLKHPIPINRQRKGRTLLERIRLAGKLRNHGSLIMFVAKDNQSLIEILLSVKDSLELIDLGDPQHEEHYHLTDNHVQKIEDKKKQNAGLVDLLIECLEKSPEIVIYDGTTKELLVDFVNVDIKF